MKQILPIVLVVATAGLIALALATPGSSAGTVGVARGSAVYGLTAKSDTPDHALDHLLAEVKRRNWDNAFSARIENQRCGRVIVYSRLDGLERESPLILRLGRL